MTRFTLFIVLLFSFSIEAADKFKIISIKELDKLLADKNKRIYLFDANVESTRTHVGILPRANLIEWNKDYDLQSELPCKLDSVLVFYCANTFCTASHMVANKVIGYGYTNVSVLNEGIYGWRKAGKKIVKLAERDPAQIKIAQVAKRVSPEEANQAVKSQKALIIDARENEERHEIIPGAQWFPMSKAMQKNEWKKFSSALPKDKNIIFHCVVGVRSKALAEKLASEGIESSYFDGPDQWKYSGLPLTPGPAR